MDHYELAKMQWFVQMVKTFEDKNVVMYAQLGESTLWVSHFSPLSPKKVMYNKYNRFVVNWNLDDIFWKP